MLFSNFARSSFLKLSNVRIQQHSLKKLTIIDYLFFKYQLSSMLNKLITMVSQQLMTLLIKSPHL